MLKFQTFELFGFVGSAWRLQRFGGDELSRLLRFAGLPRSSENPKITLEKILNS